MSQMDYCQGKRCYPDKKAAQTLLNHTRKKVRGKPGKPKDVLRMYPCPKCRQWHITKRDL